MLLAIPICKNIRILLLTDQQSQSHKKHGGLHHGCCTRTSLANPVVPITNSKGICKRRRGSDCRPCHRSVQNYQKERTKGDIIGWDHD